jgi:mono/diheme cytochrome c family protein
MVSLDHERTFVKRLPSQAIPARISKPDIGILYLPSALSSEITTCVQCHTSDRILKNLYQPPQADTSEGEG